MAFRYRVVVLLYVLALLPALVVSTEGTGLPRNWDKFWVVELVVGTIPSLLWLLVCWVVTGSSRVTEL